MSDLRSDTFSFCFSRHEEFLLTGGFRRAFHTIFLFCARDGRYGSMLFVLFFFLGCWKFFIVYVLPKWGGVFSFLLLSFFYSFLRSIKSNSIFFFMCPLFCHNKTLLRKQLTVSPREDRISWQNCPLLRLCGDFATAFFASSF